MAEVVGHARVLLRWHVSSHSSNMIKSALFSSRASSNIAGRPDWTQIVDCVALDWTRSAAIFTTADASWWFWAETIDTNFSLVWILLFRQGYHVLLLPAPFTLLACLCAKIVISASSSSPLNIKHLLTRKLAMHEAWLAKLVRTTWLDTW